MANLDLFSDPRSVTIAEWCDKLELSPKIEWESIGVIFRDGPQHSLVVEFCQDFHVTGRIHHSDRYQLFDVDLWARFGRAVRDTTLQDLHFDVDYISRVLPAAAARCIDAFMSEVKQSTSIKKASFRLIGVPMDDFIMIIQNNNILTHLSCLWVEPWEQPASLGAFDADVWMRFGKAVRSSTTLNELHLFRDGFDEVTLNGDLLAAAAACFDAFMAEVKLNKSISKAQIDLTALSMDDLGEFIQNNEALKHLMLASRERVSPNQSMVLSRAIRSVQLEEVDIIDCHFENDGVFEQIIGGCSRVDRLVVGCKHKWQCTAVAALLRDPVIVLRELVMKLLRRRRPSRHDNFRWFDKKLCDRSSIESIVNSNHTLERIQIAGVALSTLTKECLELNKYEDKAQVVHNKIRQFYFTGEFDASPFSNIPTSVLPEVVSQIKGKEKLSAIYRLLRCLPDLWNISGQNMF